jgi:hypothetical protein
MVGGSGREKEAAACFIAEILIPFKTTTSANIGSHLPPVRTYNGY